MRTLFYLFSSCLLILSAYWAYSVNYTTRAAERRVALIERQIIEETDKIEVLRAEWAYLNRPERLTRLAEANFEILRLVPVRADHFGDIASVPDETDGLGGLITNTLTAAAREEANN